MVRFKYTVLLLISYVFHCFFSFLHFCLLRMNWNVYDSILFLCWLIWYRSFVIFMVALGSVVYILVVFFQVVVYITSHAVHLYSIHPLFFTFLPWFCCHISFFYTCFRPHNIWLLFLFKITNLFFKWFK